MNREHKSEQIKSIAVTNGWDAAVVPKLEEFEKSGDINDIVWHVYAKRDRETMHVSWQGNRFQGGLYVYGDHRRKLWWRVEVVAFLRGRPDPAKFHKSGKETVDTEQEMVRSVPWEEDSPAIDIMLAVLRKEVKWVRKIDGQVCSAVVSVNLKEKGSAKHFRVYNGKNGRVLEWADATGFHAVALDQIIDVV